MGRTTRGASLNPPDPNPPPTPPPPPPGLPIVHPVPESQPVLPCLLRRLLLYGSFAATLALAKQHEDGPHFSRSLEWLLFTSLELARQPNAAVSGSGGGAKPPPRSSSAFALASGGARTAPGSPRGRRGAAPATPPGSRTLLASAAQLVRQFPDLFSDVVVAVARKTDGSYWGALFSAVGESSRLVAELVAAN